MSNQPQFDVADLDEFKRRPDIEAKIGTVIRFTKGRWMRVLAASDRNPRWIARRLRIREDLRQLPPDLDEEQLQHIMAPHYAEALVIDWGGWKSGDGTNLPCTPEVVTFVLRNGTDVYRAVHKVVQSDENFRGAEIEVATREVGN